MQNPLLRVLASLYRLLQIGLAVLGAVGLLVFIIAPAFIRPWEDAVILFAYSSNLARTGVISYFPGGPPTEGATDFLWMAILALVCKLRMDIFYLANVISAAAGIGIAILLQKIAGRRPSLYPTLVIVGLIFLTPQSLAAVGGFAVFPFGFLIALLTWLLLEHRSAAACLVALLLCLLRPDGVVFAVPLLAMFLFTAANRIRVLQWLVLLFVLPGILYFLWRWHYFGNFLPLPFWVKSETSRRFGLYVPSDPIEGLRHIEIAILVILASCGAALKLSINLRLLLSLIIIPCAFYFQMRLDQNIGARFVFFAYLAAAVLLALNWNRRLMAPQFLLPATLAVWALAVAPFWFAVARVLLDESSLPQAAIAKQLAAIPGRNSMITTEAGVLPYYSQWVAYDAWGLNTAKFARHIPLPSDVAEIHPDLVIMHRVDGSPCVPGTSWHLPYTGRNWLYMERNLIAGAAASDYDLWLESFPPGSQNYICWFVKRSSANRNAIYAVLSRNRFMSPAAVIDMEIQADREEQRSMQTQLDKISREIERLQQSYVPAAIRRQ